MKSEYVKKAKMVNKFLFVLTFVVACLSLTEILYLLYSVMTGDPSVNFVVNMVGLLIMMVSFSASLMAIAYSVEGREMLEGL